MRKQIQFNAHTLFAATALVARGLVIDFQTFSGSVQFSYAGLAPYIFTSMIKHLVYSSIQGVGAVLAPVAVLFIVLLTLLPTRQEPSEAIDLSTRCLSLLYGLSPFIGVISLLGAAAGICSGISRGQIRYVKGLFIASIPVILLSCGSGGHLKGPPSGWLASLFVSAGIGILFLGIYAYMSHRATTATSTLPHDESD